VQAGRALDPDDVGTAREADGDLPRRWAEGQAHLIDAPRQRKGTQVQGGELALELARPADDLDVPWDRGIERDVGAPLAAVPLPAALVLHRHDTITKADLRDPAIEPGSIQVFDVRDASEQELVGAGLEQEPGPVEAADRCRVLRGIVARRSGCVTERGGLGVRDGGHPAQEVVDDGELGLRIVADLRGALVGHAGHRGFHG
jgi:hypothetical protein